MMVFSLKRLMQERPQHNAKQTGNMDDDARCISHAPTQPREKLQITLFCVIESNLAYVYTDTTTDIYFI